MVNCYADLEDSIRLWKEVFNSFKNLRQDLLESAVKDFRLRAQRSGIESLNFAANRLLYIRQFGIKSINVGGPMASGKSTIAESLAELTAWKLVDADFFHPAENIRKMSEGIALTDSDRIPFLSGIKDFLNSSKTISTCSALTSSYRACLSGQCPENIGLANPWKIATPNYGLLQIIVYKPYSVALAQLDAANSGKAPARLFNGQPHFINVTAESENTARLRGQKGLLENQYVLLGDPDLILPWEAIVIKPEDYKREGKYDTKAILADIIDPELLIR